MGSYGKTNWYCGYGQWPRSWYPNQSNHGTRFPQALNRRLECNGFSACLIQASRTGRCGREQQVGRESLLTLSYNYGKMTDE